MIILDTCGLLWLAGDQSVLSARTRARLEEEAPVAVSGISAFEIGLKWLARKLELPVPPGEWWDGVVAHHCIEVLPVDAPVVTSDSRFGEYGIELLR